MNGREREAGERRENERTGVGETRLSLLHFCRARVPCHDAYMGCAPHISTLLALKVDLLHDNLSS